MEEQRREVISELDNEWHTLKHGNPVPGLYPQTGTELVKVRGSSRIEDDQSITTYEIVVSDGGTVVGRYRVIAEEQLADYDAGYAADDDRP
ncbi:MAG: hypothetical protein WD492_14560 [Alkalispirochaeta sp.]